MAWLTGPVAAGLVLLVFWTGLLASLRTKGLTYDEVGHVTAGYSYWHYQDYRLDPENGNLPQRLMALPLVWGGAQFEFPPSDALDWRNCDVWTLGRQWFQQMGHDETAMLARGRAMMSVVAVALGLLVWLWSRRLFGPIGGMLSLLLYVLSPIVLANGALMTSDTISAFFFLASVWSLWAVAHRITPGRVIAGGLCVGGLCGAKMSAVLLVVMLVPLVIARWLARRPLVLVLVPGRTRELVRPGAQVLALAAVALVQVLIAWSVVWGLYGFRYGAFGDPAKVGPGRFQYRWEMVLGKPDPVDLADQLPLSQAQRERLLQLLPRSDGPLMAWDQARLDAFDAIRREVLTPEQARQVDARLAEPPAAWPVRLVDFARKYRLLPEAYLYGYATVWRFSGIRIGFLNGDISLTGNRWFFPYAFLVKTPLSMLAICALALAVAIRRMLRASRRASRMAADLQAAESDEANRTRQEIAFDPRSVERERDVGSFYSTLPLWSLLVVYLATVLASHLNIGHRHLLTAYPPLCILGGAAVLWLAEAGWVRRATIVALGGLAAVLAVEVVYRYPNYLAYFNAIAGGPSQGYRHLVDSSLDWGQDLPAVKAYLDRHPASGPVYFSYFGLDDPALYAIQTQRLYSAPGQDVPPPMFTATLPRAQIEGWVRDVQKEHPSYDMVGLLPQADGRAQVVMLKNPGALRLSAGTYLISATMLQPLNYAITGPQGPWNERFETTYQELARAVAPLLDANPQSRLAQLHQHSPEDWEPVLSRFDAFRFARLTAYLRRREPDENINYSVLIYRLTEADLDAALRGPPPAYGPDLPKLQMELTSGK